jgi:FkbM family methyltransferase
LVKSFILNFLKSHGYELKKIVEPKYSNLKAFPRYTETSIDLLGHKHRVADGLSFYANYHEIFNDGMYEFECKKDNPVILDCGSNYGTSIIYFKSKFPNATITGIEADPKIYTLLKSNIEGRNFKDVTLINRAISADEKPIEFFCEGSDGGTTHPESHSEKSIKIDSIILDSLLTDQIDFLKMDIEGAEYDVLKSSKKLNQIDKIFIEYHSFKQSPQNLNEILTLLKDNSFRYYIHGGFCAPKPLLEEQLHFNMDMQLNIYAKKT